MNTDLLSDEEILSVFKKLSKEDRNKLKHLLWVVDMEEVDPKKQKSYFDEFRSIYLCDDLAEGCVVDFIKSEIEDLSKRTDEGSMERVFYLGKWVEDKFGSEVLEENHE